MRRENWRFLSLLHAEKKKKVQLNITSHYFWIDSAFFPSRDGLPPFLASPTSSQSSPTFNFARQQLLVLLLLVLLMVVWLTVICFRLTRHLTLWWKPCCACWTKTWLTTCVTATSTSGFWRPTYSWWVGLCWQTAVGCWRMMVRAPSQGLPVWDLFFCLQMVSLCRPQPLFSMYDCVCRCASLCLCLWLALFVSVFQSVCLSVCLSMCPSIYLRLSMCVSLSVCVLDCVSRLSGSLHVCLSINHPVTVLLCVFLCVCLCLSVSVCVSACVSLPSCLCVSSSQSVCLLVSVSPPVCLHVCLSLAQSVSVSFLCVCLAVCVSLHVCLCLHISLLACLCLHVCLCLCLYIDLPACLCLSMSVFVSILIYLPACVTPCLSLSSLSPCLLACLSPHPSSSPLSLFCNPSWCSPPPPPPRPVTCPPGVLFQLSLCFAGYKGLRAHVWTTRVSAPAVLPAGPHFQHHGRLCECFCFFFHTHSAQFHSLCPSFSLYFSHPLSLSFSLTVSVFLFVFWLSACLSQSLCLCLSLSLSLSLPFSGLWAGFVDLAWCLFHFFSFLHLHRFFLMMYLFLSVWLSWDYYSVLLAGS